MKYEVEYIAPCSDKQYHEIYLRMPRDRKEQTDRYKFTADKRRSVFAYGLLERLLGTEYPDASASILRKDANGMPYLGDKSICISLSHSGDYVACAVSSSGIGIDIETYRSVDKKLLLHTCTDRELEFILCSSDCKDSPDIPLTEEEKKRFLCVWCAKEAYLKLKGTGLAGGIASVEVANKSGIKETLSDGVLIRVTSTPDYVLAVAYIE